VPNGLDEVGAQFGIVGEASKDGNQETGRILMAGL
jgi:hypothetical protein